jgi:autotransporter-associated beta strand protein
VESNQLAPRYAVWFPAKSALQTSNAAAAIVWVTNNTTATLTFPGAGGAPTTLTALLGLANTNNSGAWAVDADGDWSDTNNWSGGIVANGAGNLADFSELYLTADRTVTLDSSRSIGALYFDDLSGAHNWVLANSGGAAFTLNNGSSSPLMIVYGAATISAPLAGANGFTKTGFGTVVLSGSNSLAGTLYVDTATSAAVNDGAVCIARSASVANIASPIYIKNNNSGSSTLQLDGSGGDVTVAQNISLAGRNVPVIAIQNLAGSNTLAGNFILTSGGQYYWLDSDAGTLALAGQLPSSAPTVPSARTLTFMGAGNFVVSGAINNANGYPVNLVKSDSGTLTLNGTNTYTGQTTVNDGTLAGNGFIAGPVAILPGATLSPGGNTIGALTINNALTNTGTILVRLAKSGATRTNDAITGLSVLNCGGILTVTNVGPNPLTAGDSFQLFSAANIVGNFAATNLPPLGIGLLWSNRVAADGTLAVVLGVVAPQFASVAWQGTNLVFNGSGGAAWADYSVLASTNLTVPLANWSVVATGTFDGAGNFMFTNQAAPGMPRQFFNLRIP